MMRRHFVTFLSPGTFVSEQTQKPIESWDVEVAVETSRSIKERYGATPYGFYFSTRERKDDELDSREVKRSGIFYLGGTILTLNEIEKRNNPENEILIANMKGNKWDQVIENCNSYKSTFPLENDDIILEYEP